MHYNQAQKDAIAHKDGPCMVLAGPGSGKTFTITKRIAYLIREYEVLPEEILVITFTKAAAHEMKERFRKEMGEKGNRVTFGTFHGIYYGILKWAYGLKAENILSEEEKYSLLRMVIGNIDLELEIDDEKEFLQGIAAEISTIKNNQIELSTYISGNCPKETFIQIYEAYEKERNRHRKIDFDDMLSMTYQLLVERPDYLKLWQKKFRYILIDEFQDVNTVQYQVIRMLAAPENNLFVVGDDDQSIYRFRGAKPDIMLGFPKDFPNTRMLVLGENYRSTKAIVNAASRVIGSNRNRYDKQLKTRNEQGDTVHIQEVLNPLEESKYVVGEIQKRRKQGIPFTDMAVLFRSHTDARVLAETCMEYHIPFQMKEHFFNVYEHFVGKDIIAYIKFAHGDRSRRHFLAIMNRPNRYIGRECVDGMEISFEELRTFYCDKDWMLDRIDRLEVDLKIIRKMAPYAAIQYIRKHVGYDTFLEEYAKYRKIRLEDLREILSEIEERARAFSTAEEWFAHVEEYTQHLKILEQQKEQSRPGVAFMTMHGAKGLEFDTVFIIGANEKITPYKKAETKEEIEEERRMFYVAMTRAKKKLIISYTKERNGKPMTQSRFVGEVLARK